MPIRLKVIISAYACSPNLGSEAGVGWGFVSALAKKHDVYVITQYEKFKPEIDKLIKIDSSIESIKFFGINRTRGEYLEKIWPPSYYWTYRRWHWDAYQLARTLHQQIQFDLAHQLTMVGFREPGYLWKLGIPFIWGPIGGMGLFPWRFLPKVGGYGALYYLGYNLFNGLHMRFLARPRRAARAAGDGLIAATPENRDNALKYWGCAGTVLCEVGLPQEPLSQIQIRSPVEPLRIVWTGQHIPRKALNLGLEALGRLAADVNWELHVLGEGQRTASWQRLAARLGIAARCRFYGWLPRDRALATMNQAHLLLITSLRDLTSTVTIEALALGLPIVCLDHCGFAEVVNDSCGIKIPVTTPTQVIAGLAAAIQRLAEDEPLRQTLARGALERAREFSWERKAAVVNDLYRRKLGGPPATAR